MLSPNSKIALLFDKYGPYHYARLRQVQTQHKVTGVELRQESKDYTWLNSKTSSPDSTSVGLIRVQNQLSQDYSPRAYKKSLWRCLDNLVPNVVAIPGWSSSDALAALEWCGRQKVPAIIMSDSTFYDAPRTFLKEAAKSILLSGAASVFVAGSRSRDYVSSLGFPDDRIYDGYDAVDENHFGCGANKARASGISARQAMGLPEEYFLYVGRLLPRKNVSTLISAFKSYIEKCKDGQKMALVIAGDGECKQPLADFASRLGVAQQVLFLGHVSYDDLPVVYAFARALVLPSLVEQWGLVVNEALAAGVPVIVSEKCGCATDLVSDRRTGSLFDPTDSHELAGKLELFSDKTFSSGCMDDCRIMASNWGLERFRRGLFNCVESALLSNISPGLMSTRVSALLAKRDSAGG